MMKPFTKSLRQLAMLSTAILPVLAISSCSDDDRPASQAGDDEAAAQQLLTSFRGAFLANSLMNIHAADGEFTYEGMLIRANSELLSSCRLDADNETMGHYTVTIFNEIAPAAFTYNLPVNIIANPADNSIYWKIEIPTIRSGNNHVALGVDLPVVYHLYYNLTEDTAVFELDLIRSHYLIEGDIERYFQSGETKPVPFVTTEPTP